MQKRKLRLTEEGPLGQTHTFVIKRFVEFWG